MRYQSTSSPMLRRESQKEVDCLKSSEAGFLSKRQSTPFCDSHSNMGENNNSNLKKVVKRGESKCHLELINGRRRMHSCGIY